MSWFVPTDNSERTLGAALSFQAATQPDAVFLMDPDVRLTFAEVDRRVNRLANGLRALGLGAGQRVVLLMENSAEMAVAALAITRLRAIWVPINTALKGDWLADAISSAEPTMLVVDHELIDLLAALSIEGVDAAVISQDHGLPAPERLAGVPVAGTIEAVLSEDASEPAAGCDYRDVVAVMWTSGTTGRPKGIMQTHASWLYGADGLGRWRDLRDDDVLYCYLPMFNSGGWSLNVFGALVSGRPIGIDRTFSASAFWDRCRHYGATQIVTLGAMYEFLLQQPPSATDRDHAVRVCSCLPIPAARLRDFQERFGIPSVWSGYAQSELMNMTGCEIGKQWKPDSCGVADDRIELRILDEDDRILEPFEVGEICIRPREPHLMFAGYFHAPELTTAATRNLWFHTGDLGYLDADGELFFADRRSDLMRFGGRTISSADVERAAVAHPSVLQAAAHPVASESVQSETEVMLTVVPEPGATLAPAELARFINDTAPHYLVPRYIDLVDQLPLTPTGKVEKRTLKDRGLTPTTWDRVAAGFVVTKKQPQEAHHED